MKKHKKECQFCYETFLSKRNDAKTCGNACRVALSRENKSKKLKISVTKERLTVTNCELPVTKSKINVTETKLCVSEPAGIVTIGQRVIDPLLDNWNKFCDKRDERRRLLPYTEECCKLCSKNVNV